ncbi:MAG: RluA family pseudouridine synthase [Phycisphaeraceae bacterium]
MSRSNKGDILSAGDTITLIAAYAHGETPLADDSLEIEVVSEGDGWLVIDKPAGVPVRPHALDEMGTVLNAVVARYPQIIGVGEGGLRSGIVHRLDTDTSGTLMVATQQYAWERLRGAFAEHQIQKRYTALVQGEIDGEGVTRRHLRVAAHQPARVLVEPEAGGSGDARLCSLGWQVVERFGDRASLVEVDLHTGFLHQVRVMMAELGHPVIGDTTYGKDTLSIQAPRQMLHANSLSLGAIHAEAPIPSDMQKVLQSIRDDT